MSEHLQQAIDESLKRTMQPPSQQRLDAIADAACRAFEATPAVSSGLRGLRRLALAASIAGAVLGGSLIWRALAPRGGGYERQAWASFETVYRAEVAGGLEPLWVCETDEEFGSTFADRFGQKLLLAQLPAGTEALGLSYCHSLTPRTTYLLATAQGRPVIVFIDLAEHDRGRARPDVGDLNLYRREVGRLVLYEVSGLETPILLDHFYNP